METNGINIERLIRLALLGAISATEKEKLSAWLDERPENRSLFEKIQREVRSSEELPVFCRLDEEEAWERFRRSRGRGRGRRLVALRYAAAVAVLVGVALSVWIYKDGGPSHEETAIVPGSPKATLTVASGESVVLGDGGAEKVVEVTSGRQAKRSGDSLIYAATCPAAGAEEFNTLSIPKGGEFKLVLSDGTMVYLNAATRLRYPVAFGGNERRVRLEGEAYFEVARDSARPFYVEAGDLRVRVYGTSFNVNTQREGETQAVLVEGCVGVKVAGMVEEVEMKPGELLRYDRGTGTLSVKSVDTRQYVAWKDGYFAFEDARLEEIMQKLALWYNVEVFFQSEEAKRFVFTGFMRKYEQIDTILAAVRDVTGVRYSISGRTVVISR